ncbi:UNVERIFIED_ORG: hypothetical protein BDU10_3094 [Burkholderia sp. CF145]
MEFGESATASRVAFGDDSPYRDCLCYAFVVLRRTRLTRLIRRLNILKKEFGFPLLTPIHCRVLFSGDQRRKAGLSHLSFHDARSLVARVITAVNDIEGHVRYAHTSLNGFANTMGEEISVWDPAIDTFRPQAVNADPKSIMAALMNMCIITPPKDPSIPSPYLWQVIASRDATKVPALFGDGFRQAHHAVDMFSDIGVSAAKSLKLRPVIADVKEEPLLQVADVISYVCAHAIGGDGSDPFWKEQLQRVRSWQQINFVPMSPN